jgi:hypothetical protein
MDRGPRLAAARDQVRCPAFAAHHAAMHEVPHGHPLGRSALAGLRDAAARTPAFTRRLFLFYLIRISITDLGIENIYLIMISSYPYITLLP